MKYSKTYCKPGLLEWMGYIHVGKNKMLMKMSGGSQTAYGTNPASFTTTDEFTQKFIEMSEEYQRGVIKILRLAEIADVDSNKEDVPQNEERTVVEVPPVSNEVSNPNLKVVQVADRNEAIEYLKENFGSEYSASKLRSNKALEEAAEQCGIKFEFAE